jgi:hypothetical protein
MVAAVKEYAKDFYQSAAWKRARQTVIKRANGLCERCKAAGQFVPGVIVHHKEYITPGNIHDASVTLNLDNLELVCEDCHNKEHKTKPNGRYRFGSDGRLLPPMQQDTPGVVEKCTPQKNRGSDLKKTLQGRTHMRGG